MPDLTGHDHRPSAFIVYLYLWSRMRGQQGQGAACSYQDLATDTGLAKRTVQIAVRHLIRRKLLSVQQASSTAVPVYKVLTPWRRRAAG